VGVVVCTGVGFDAFFCGLGVVVLFVGAFRIVLVVLFRVGES